MQLVKVVHLELHDGVVWYVSRRNPQLDDMELHYISSAHLEDVSSYYS